MYGNDFVPFLSLGMSLFLFRFSETNELLGTDLFAARWTSVCIDRLLRFLAPRVLLQARVVPAQMCILAGHSNCSGAWGRGRDLFSSEGLQF